MRTGLRAVKTCEGRGGTECRPSASSPRESVSCSPVSHALELCGPYASVTEVLRFVLTCCSDMAGPELTVTSIV